MNSIFPKSDYFNKYLGCEWMGRGGGVGEGLRVPGGEGGYRQVHGERADREEGRERD